MIYLFQNTYTLATPKSPHEALVFYALTTHHLYEVKYILLSQGSRDKSSERTAICLKDMPSMQVSWPLCPQM